jgi:hypothetical protein
MLCLAAAGRTVDARAHRTRLESAHLQHVSARWFERSCAAACKVRYLDGRVVSTKGEKVIIEKIGEEWDGGSRGKVGRGSGARASPAGLCKVARAQAC